MVLLCILASIFLVSIISLVGIITLSIKDNLVHKMLFCLIGFSAGALFGTAFLHILPESLENNKSETVFFYIVPGIIAFFLMERYLHWRHCHEDGGCRTHAFTYLNLVGWIS
ncbi:MAG: ZIP family metal transporter [Candidatus Omnitrophica bacterium]|jgi:zinc and cadmium transporter|nr:ZIP family metal transporter [Candidatus Omnitrophota bacterium]